MPTIEWQPFLIRDKQILRDRTITSCAPSEHRTTECELEDSEVLTAQRGN
jgi:hypothetical protein